MAEQRPDPKIHREVLPPQNPYSGLGVVLVASLAMFLAMASSAFAIRARMAKQVCPTQVYYQATLPAAQSWHSVELDPAPVCGVANYRTNDDGSVSVYYHPCKGESASASVKGVHVNVP